MQQPDTPGVTIPCWLIVTLQLAATTIIIIYEADIIVQSFSISFMARFQRTVKREIVNH